ncbi:MAG TPA: CoA ester lyase [Amycolatopsis sp.]|uniref:HpcH/HpaI aldolase/citrate lyase family protein n=1 Tax=Amycolatopsis sp. TaxID=37632 RepID=UPI002B45B4A3|nr:CoA ester lyase [Amycolatopsis sp.]HKS46474.1 CoA ester lyase [Amycolatopsis sp.]
MRERLAAARTLLFVPGHRPDRFAKAMAAGADGVVLDLEDAVGPDDKPAARAAVAEWLAQHGTDVLVRINAPGTPWFDEDLELVAKHGCAAMIPKAEDRGTLEGLELPLVIPLVETAAGVLKAAEICAARGVVRAAFGSVDLAGQLGVAPDDHLALTHARSALVLASASAGVASPLDGVTTNLSDLEVLREDMRMARRLGYTGKLCIHPRQVEPLHALLAPTPEELAWAEEVIAAGGDGAATAVAGHMVDKPVLERARRLLERAGLTAPPR